MTGDYPVPISLQRCAPVQLQNESSQYLGEGAVISRRGGWSSNNGGDKKNVSVEVTHLPFVCLLCFAISAGNILCSAVIRFPKPSCAETYSDKLPAKKVIKNNPQINAGNSHEKCMSRLLPAQRHPGRISRAPAIHANLDNYGNRLGDGCLGVCPTPPIPLLWKSNTTKAILGLKRDMFRRVLEDGFFPTFWTVIGTICHSFNPGFICLLRWNLPDSNLCVLWRPVSFCLLESQQQNYGRWEEAKRAGRWKPRAQKERWDREYRRAKLQWGLMILERLGVEPLWKRPILASLFVHFSWWNLLQGDWDLSLRHPKEYTAITPIYPHLFPGIICQPSA